MDEGTDVERRLASLRQILETIGPSVVAFSGGVDSAFLLRVAHDVLGEGVLAVTGVSASLPTAEKDATVLLAGQIGARHLLVATEEIDNPDYVRNDERRCYFCKRELFEVLRRIAAEAGHGKVLYGAIPDDLADDRPGMQAAGQAGVRAPLIEAGLSKEMIRALSRRLGLPTWDKPAAACLASRIPRFTPVTVAALARVERAEAAAHGLGYRQVRVRQEGKAGARVELDGEGLRRAASSEARRGLIEAVQRAGFDEVWIDPLGYRPGGRPAAAPSLRA
jgi:uncharacterized protein